jgi:hypothetical protein
MTSGKRRLAGNLEGVGPIRETRRRLITESSIHDQASQTVRSAHIFASIGGTTIYLVTIR